MPLSTFPDYRVGLVKSRKSWERVRPHLEVTPLLAFDIETTDLVDHTIWGLPMAIPPRGGRKGLAVYIACETWNGCELDFHKDLKEWFEWMFEDDEREWVGHNLKFDTGVLRSNGFRNLPANIFDTMIASWMLRNEERRHALDIVAQRELALPIPKDLMAIREHIADDPKFYWNQMTRYGANDGIVPLKLRARFIKMLEAEHLVAPAKRLEMPMVEVTGEMQTRGLCVDVPHLKGLSVELNAQLADLTTEIHTKVGYDFNINSPVQLSEALFDSPDGLEIPVLKGMTRGKPRGKALKPGAWKTGVEILKSLDHPICKQILDWREAKKMLGTYVDPFIVRAEADPDGRIRSNWNQTGTSTGRFSSSGPNMQNLPRRSGAIRKAMIAPTGFTFLTCDYSQIELRLMAHQSGDPTMIDLYSKGADLHRKTAADAMGVPEAGVTKEMRQLAKAINFGYLYGMSAQRFKQYAWLSFGVKVTDAQAVEFRRAYFASYPGIVEYHELMKEHIYEHGWAENIVGERRYLPAHRSGDSLKRWQAWSEGVNYTIQGSAAAMMKAAMLRMYRGLYRPYGKRVSQRYGRVITLWGSSSNLAHEVQMVGQVHDEIQWYVRHEIAELFAEWVKTHMETAIGGFRVPIIVETGMGPDMESAK